MCEHFLEKSKNEVLYTVEKLRQLMVKHSFMYYKGNGLLHINLQMVLRQEWTYWTRKNANCGRSDKTIKIWNKK